MSPAPSRTAWCEANGPRYWRDEQSGVLAAAVRSYLDNPNAMTLRDVAYLRAYLRQWIGSAVWEMAPSMDHRSRAALAVLRASIDRIHDAAGIGNWLRLAMQEGIDPL